MKNTERTLMRVTVIDEKTGEIFAVDPPFQGSAAAPLIIDNESGFLPFSEEHPVEHPAAWRPVKFRDGRTIEVNLESGEIVGE